LVKNAVKKIMINYIGRWIGIVLIGLACRSESELNNITFGSRFDNDRIKELWISAGRDQVPDRWYEKTAAIKVVTLKKDMAYGHDLSLNPKKLSAQLDQTRSEGFQAIEIFAAAHGLKTYNGLDVVNHYTIDPELGTMDDFRLLVRMAHDRNIAVLIFINLGYYSKEAPDWIEACRDKKAGIETEKVKWFLWSDRADSPPPPTQEDIYKTQQDRDNIPTWGWQYSELADSYFWARWQTVQKSWCAV